MVMVKELMEKKKSDNFRDSRNPVDKKVEELKMQEHVVRVNRVAKVVKGGRRFSFTALVVVGDGQGQVGAGYGKAREVAEAVRKAVEDAKKHIIKIQIKGATIPHEIIGKHGVARVLLKPAVEGTGIRAGSSVRAVVESAGIHNILAKSLGSDNAINVVAATIDGLRRLKDVEAVTALRTNS